MNREMKSGGIVVSGFRNNDLFDASSPHNRDDCLLQWRLLRDCFYENGVVLNTLDQCDESCLDFVIHVDVRVVNKGGPPCFLVVYETPLTWPKNANLDLYSSYRHVFTWDDDVAESNGGTVLRYPQYAKALNSDTAQKRKKLCCMIASNKSANVNDGRELYSDRIKVIRWFQDHAPEHFDLYGHRWDQPPPSVGRLGRGLAILIGKCYRFVGYKPFMSYCGPISSKGEVLGRYKFAICFENAKDFKGYVTEKIFDCFAAGCIPIYLGASNISELIPDDCFIDYRTFGSFAKCYEYMCSVSDEQLNDYQLAISNFLVSRKAVPFHPANFAKTIVHGVMAANGWAKT
jgi:hypothetical protein